MPSPYHPSSRYSASSNARMQRPHHHLKNKIQTHELLSVLHQPHWAALVMFCLMLNVQQGSRLPPATKQTSNQNQQPNLQRHHCIIITALGVLHDGLNGGPDQRSRERLRSSEGASNQPRRHSESPSDLASGDSALDWKLRRLDELLQETIGQGIRVHSLYPPHHQVHLDYRAEQYSLQFITLYPSSSRTSTHKKQREKLMHGQKQETNSA